MNRHRLLPAIFASLLLGTLPGLARAADPKLSIHWVDVEGGAATLIITPAGESVLIDSGSAGGRDPGRIQAAARAAGVQKMDYFVLTHFHTDHFGGIPEVAQLLPVGVVYDKGLPAADPDGNRSDTRFPLLIKPYREMKVAERRLIHPGDTLPLRQLEQTPKLTLRCLGANQQFVAAPTDAHAAPDANCADAKTKGKDTSDNANSVVVLLEYGDFRLFIAGDLTWDVEARLACPVNLVGPVDVYQVTHHGLAASNNPLLVRALQPTVAIMSNGTQKGCEPETCATLTALPGMQARYQIHRNLRPDAQNNTASEYIANLEKNCAGNAIQITVAPDTHSYEVTIPATGHHRQFTTQKSTNH